MTIVVWPTTGQLVPGFAAYIKERKYLREWSTSRAEAVRLLELNAKAHGIDASFTVLDLEEAPPDAPYL